VAKKKLNNSYIKSVQPQEKRIEIYDTLVAGLALRVTPTGHKSFVYRYRYKNKIKRFTIGTYPKIGLATARNEAKNLSYEVNNGTDPMAEKKKARYDPGSVTLNELAKEFKGKYLPTLRKGTRYEYARIIDKELIPTLGSFEIKEISRHQVINLLDKKAYDEGYPTMANRIRSRLSKMYSFAIDRGLIDYNPVISTPKYSAGENKRDRYYEEDEIKKLWKAFENQEDPARSIFKMLLLTGQRKGETSRMKWECIQDDVWTIPAEDAKGKRAHDVPLSPSALEILKEMRLRSGKSEYVFESPVIKNRPVQEVKRVAEHIRKESKVKDFRPHDLRRTAATYMAKLGVERTVLGKILNHKGLAGDGQVTAIYDRHSYMDEKRRALILWSNHLKGILSEEEKKEARIYRIGR